MTLHRVIEFAKYDYNGFKSPLSWMAGTLAIVLGLIGYHRLAFPLVRMPYVWGWGGSEKAARRFIHAHFVKNPADGSEIVQHYLNNLPLQERFNRFLQHPEKMLGRIITVLRNPTDTEKGVLIVNYSYFFPLLLTLYDFDRIQEQFFVILEPSWAGLMDLSILAFSSKETPIFVQAYESRDRELLKAFSHCLPFRTMNVGPNWFIDHRNFVSGRSIEDRDIDVIMVAAWARFKRHGAFLKCIKALREERPHLKVSLVGYPVDLQLSDIEKLLAAHGLQDCVALYENVSTEEVSGLLQRSKCQVLWSKFEGNNRAIIEGLLCDTPLILRQGHNYGQHYDYINEQTGSFAGESSFSSVYKMIEENWGKFTPRQWVMKNRTCERATDLMQSDIRQYCEDAEEPFSGSLAVKINNLSGMNYFDQNDSDYQRSYELLEAATKKSRA